MKMGTYDNRNPMISEPNMEASVPYFSWMNPGNFFSATKVGLNPFQASQMDPNPGLSALPICSVTPMTEPINNTEFETNPTKAKKKKSSAKSPNQKAPKVLSPKQPQKKPSASKKSKRQLEPGTKVERKNLNIVFNEANLDFSGVPPPYCSCTGVDRSCYKWGAGGWQSSCCTINISEYPLPMSSSRPGARLAGRKMSIGAYGKLLCRLGAEGHDLSHPVDLKNHWARHGTNKFVTIK
ncbi:Protein BASIC like [Actinidia chinensis var. chinensis]|uniref:GAGA-binding transcriptional activator n=1 Tax=Actinidia chinensis var. chinensis TaxID=1590841 RepID=A0A2R6Q3A7_ACTCC|nr:Protein BASIC like [Actinidia chinensis var. chinensis]